MQNDREFTAICIIVDRFRFSVECASVCSKHLKMEAGIGWSKQLQLYLVHVSDRRYMTSSLLTKNELIGALLVCISKQRRTPRKIETCLRLCKSLEGLKKLISTIAEESEAAGAQRSIFTFQSQVFQNRREETGRQSKKSAPRTRLLAGCQNAELTTSTS